MKAIVVKETVQNVRVNRN